MLNYSAELLPRKGFNEQNLYTVEAAHRRRLLHKYIGAVAGLAEYMAGLRFLYVLKLALFLPKEIISTNL